MLVHLKGTSRYALPALLAEISSLEAKELEPGARRLSLPLFTDLPRGHLLANSKGERAQKGGSGLNSLDPRALFCA
jgi:hypothetical protein